MRIRPNHVILLVVLLGFGVFFARVLVQPQVGSKRSTDGVITQVVGAVKTDSSATFDIVFSEGDPAHESTHVFESLQGATGMGEASLDTKTSKLTVSYDSTSLDEASIRSLLAAAGYVKITAADATTAELAADGKVQRIAVKDKGGFSPAYIRVKSGVPLDIEFAPGVECRVSMSIPALGITQDISKGAVVKVPALKPGTYPILCSGGGNEGAILAE